jgi:hypothetical protein
MAAEADSVGRPPAVTAAETSLERLARLLLDCPDPPEALTAYLTQVPRGGALRQDLRRLAETAPPPDPTTPSLRDAGLIATRARRLLEWLEGDAPATHDPFKALGLSHSSTREQVVRQYRALCKSVHPDRHGAERTAYWHDRQSEISWAYGVLSDAEKCSRWLADHERRLQLLHRVWEFEQAPADPSMT